MSLWRDIGVVVDHQALSPIFQLGEGTAPSTKLHLNKNIYFMDEHEY